MRPRTLPTSQPSQAILWLCSLAWIVLFGFGCASTKGALLDIADGIVDDHLEELEEYLDSENYPDVYAVVVRLQGLYARVRGTPTVMESFSPECNDALNTFFGFHVGGVWVSEKSELVSIVERFSPLVRIRAIAIGNAIYVGRDAELDLPHELVHIHQGQIARDTYPAQYLPVVLIHRGEGYEKSLLEVEARNRAEEFRAVHGSLCDRPAGGAI